MYRLDCSRGDEEMERGQREMTEVERFENKSKDEPGDDRYHTWPRKS